MPLATGLEIEGPEFLMRDVPLHDDERIVPAKGQAPSAPVRIPDEVFLSVRWPQAVSEDPSVFVQGDAPPGTIVVVNGEEAAIEPGGRFRVRVGLKEGPNKIEVSAEGPDGRTEKRTREVVRRIPYGPPLEADPSHLYDPPRPK